MGGSGSADDFDGADGAKFMSERDKKEQHMKSMFKDQQTGAHYDPVKKFGTIDGDQALIYDNITTSYPVNLPSEYY